jgi:2,5-diketo-D-gluconate reductase A
VPRQDRYVETWEALRELRDAGRVRAVGVCNFHEEHLQRAHDETGEWPSINQVELHPYLQQVALRAFHEEHGIVTESWSPLASGQRVLDAQVVIAWHLALGLVVIPKSVTPSRIVENLEAVDLTLTGQDVDELSTLDRGFRTGPNPDDFNEV